MKKFYLFEIFAVRPQGIVRIISVAIPITAHRDEEFAEFFKATARRVVAPYNTMSEIR